MQFLVLTTRKSAFTEEEFTPRLESEAQVVRQLYKENFIRQIWLRGDRKGACMMIEAATEEEVRLRLAELPLAKAGMIELASVIPLNPYTGFGPRLH